MARGDHDTPGMVYACPECDSTNIRHRGPSKNVEHNPRYVYHCPDCEAGFNKPVERRDKGTIGTSSDELTLDLEELAGENDWYRKPDPDEPWRYVCPECGTTALQRHPVASKEDGVECKECSWYGRLSELHDKKTDDG